jgi:hypothetical protein
MAAQRVSVPRHIIALLTAIVLTPVGIGLVWYGSGLAYGQSSHGGSSIVGVLVAIAGIAVLLTVVQTGHVSSLGLTVVALAVGIFGLVTVLSSGTAGDVSTWLRGFSPDLVRGAALWMNRGGVLTLGCLLGAVAISSSLARRPTDVSSSPFIRNLLSILLALAAAVAGLGFFAIPAPSRVIIGAILIGVVVLTTSISAAGAYVAGVILLLGGLLGFWLPDVASALSAPFTVFGGGGGPTALPTVFEMGLVAAAGAITLASALVVQSVRSRSARRAATV